MTKDEAKELKKYVEEADHKNLADCLKENFAEDGAERLRMLSDIYLNDKSHFHQLSRGCQAAMMLYLSAKGVL